MRSACAGDAELGQLLTHMMLSNDEFRSHVAGPAADLALPSILQMMRSKEGIEGCVQFYTGATPPDSRVVRVSSLPEWKNALDAAGDRPVCALFTTSDDIGCRILVPGYNKVARYPPQLDQAPSSTLPPLRCHRVPRDSPPRL